MFKLWMQNRNIDLFESLQLIRTLIMRRYSGLCFFLLLLVFSNCVNTSTKINAPISESLPVNGSLLPLESGEIHLSDEVFGTIIDLIGQPIETREITRAIQLLVKDNFLIINNQREDSIFMIFELPHMKCVAAFGRRGRGPDEFVFPNIVKTEEDSILFYIYEQVNDKVYKVPVNNMKPAYYITLPKQDRGTGDKQVQFIDNKVAYYCASTETGKEIYYFNIDSLPDEKSIINLAIPKYKGSWTTYIGDFGTNVHFGRIAYAYKYFKRLKIIDIKNLDQKDIIFDVKEIVKGQNDLQTLEPTNITHFWGMSPCEKYFWMLYSGRTPVDVQQDNRSNKKYIFVEQYDWNGNPEKKYKLDDWGYFCVDEKNETLYLSSTASIFSLLKYDLSDPDCENK